MRRYKTLPMTQSGIRRAKQITHEQPCLVCGKYGVDAAHYPLRRSHGAGLGLLEVIPLCRFHHRLLDEGNPTWKKIVGELAFRYHERMLKCYENSDVYLGT